MKLLIPVVLLVVILLIILIKSIKAMRKCDDEIKFQKWQYESENTKKQQEELKQFEIEQEKEFYKLQSDVLKHLEHLGFKDWNFVSRIDENITVKCLQDLKNYDQTKFFQKNREKLEAAKDIIERKRKAAKILRNSLKDNNYKSHSQYKRLKNQINDLLDVPIAYIIQISYITSAGIHSDSKEILVTQGDIIRFSNNPQLVMTEEERHELQVQQEKERLRLQRQQEQEYQDLKLKVSKVLGLKEWDTVGYLDKSVIVKSRQALDNYNELRYFKENPSRLELVERAVQEKENIALNLRKFLENNIFTTHPQYNRLVKEIQNSIKNANAYRILVKYISSAGNYLGSKEIWLTYADINQFRDDPSLLMSKSEYRKVLIEQEKEKVNQRHHKYYERVNNIIDYANENRKNLIIKGSQERLDSLIAQLFDRTVNSIKKIKTYDSEEWNVIGDFISQIQDEIEKTVELSQKILAYYNSLDFLKIKDTCDTIMSTQREFNEYINEKVQSISSLFGTRVVRGETVNNDEYHYIRPYKKTITPFTAEVSAAVFSSAENNSLEYVVKKFYPNKKDYPEQIQKLCRLVEELETLKDAKQIIENYKRDYQQYLGEVPDYIMENDEAGFYSRLGFATIDESVLSVEYKFVYTSNGGMAQRAFTVPMTEETIGELIKALESKLTASAFVKEQRTLMTKKLRDYIKTRDNFTCCICGNSTKLEPNLLLEIDHIIPVSKGGCTTKDNLQTLCWKCNRTKSDKVLA